jgi:tetratricopeptide (TPR) repeat protein
MFQEAVSLARQAGDVRVQSLLFAVNSNLAASQNDFAGMKDHAQQAVELADRAGDRSTALFARYFLGRALVWQGGWEAGVGVYDQCIEIAGGDDAAAIEVLRYRPYVECLAIRANALTVLGRLPEAFEYVDKFPSLSRLAGVGADLSSAASDRMWPCLVAGMGERARQYADEALQVAERYGGERGVVYALMACGSASVLAQRWSEGNSFLERAQQRILATGAGAEWNVPLDAFQALCLAGLGMRERCLALVRRSAEGPDSGLRPLVGFLRARALRMLGDAWDELEGEISGTVPALQSVNGQGVLSLLILERAGLARARGDAEGFERDLAEVRQRFARMCATGWDDYLKTIAVYDL